MPHRPGPILLLLLALLPACPPPHETACNSDGDCTNGQRCALGLCAAATDATELDAGLADDGGAGNEGDAGAPDAGTDAAADAGPDAGADPDDAGTSPDAGPVDAGPLPCPGARPHPAPCSPTHTGLAACWDFETADGTTPPSLTVEDSVAGATASGTGTLVPGVRGNGFDPGATGSLSLSPPETLTVQGALSLDVWVFARSLPAGTRQAVYDAEGQMALFLQEGGVACAARKVQQALFRIVSSGFPLNAWTHVSCTLGPDGQGLILYVNGVQAIQGNHDGTLQPSTGDIFLAANSPNGAEQLDGIIDEMRVFRVRRSAADACWAAQP